MLLAVFFLLLIDSTCFGHYYAHHQELATLLLKLLRWSFRSVKMMELTPRFRDNGSGWW